MDKPKVLILGGTGEARALATRAIERLGDRAEIISSQAGVTRQPEAVPGRLVTGGFGGINGLQDFITNENIKIVIDATHAFAATISDNAYIACMATRAKRISLVRPCWQLPEQARVFHVSDMVAAADAIQQHARRVFVTTGRRGLGALQDLEDIWFLIRMIEPLEEALPITNYHLITDRPPFSLDQEAQILKDYEIDGLLTKASGGDATYAKIEAASAAGIAIIMLDRPDLVPGDWTNSIDDCVAWVEAQL